MLNIYKNWAEKVDFNSGRAPPPPAPKGGNVPKKLIFLTPSLISIKKNYESHPLPTIPPSPPVGSIANINRKQATTAILLILKNIYLIYIYSLHSKYLWYPIHSLGEVSVEVLVLNFIAL